MRRKAPVNSNCKNCTFFKNAIISINYGMIGKKKLAITNQNPQLLGKRRLF